MDQKIKEIKRFNAELSEDQKHKKIQIEVKNKVLYLNKVPQKKHIHPPKVKEVLNVDITDKFKWKCLTSSTLRH